MHVDEVHHQHAFSTQYASISTKAELKVHVFLNVAHQQGCKNLSKEKFTFFIHSLLRDRTDGDNL